MDAEYRHQTVAAYDAMAQELASGYAAYFRHVAHAEAERFVSDLPAGYLILDLGCGAGVASRFFQSRGRRPICADLSIEMLRLCRDAGLRHTLRLDIERLPLGDASVAACWAHTSLIHMPKSHLTRALKGIARVLVPGGRLFVALREGAGEGYQGEPGHERWFAEYAVGEFERHVPGDLNNIGHTVTTFGRRRFLNYHLLRA